MMDFLGIILCAEYFLSKFLFSLLLFRRCLCNFGKCYLKNNLKNRFKNQKYQVPNNNKTKITLLTLGVWLNARV